MKEPVRVHVQPQVELRNFLEESQEHSHHLWDRSQTGMSSVSSTEDTKAQGTWKVGH